MPSPFPGMDPYLEDPDYWPGMHNGLIYCIASALNEALPEGYVAQQGARLYVVQPQRDIYPDVTLLRSPHSERRHAPVSRSGGGGAAVAAREDAPEIVTDFGVEHNEGYIEIRKGKKPGRIVTAIEILSPANKEPGEGRRKYRQKQEEALTGGIHLLEIDLLRRGQHTVAASFDLIAEHGRWDYLACLSRASSRGDYEVWRIGVRRRLPRVYAPLADGDPDVHLDLQAVLNRAYDEGRYAELLDYAQPPNPPLEGADADWADALLREKGLR